jgi:hypothetical protein
MDDASIRAALGHLREHDERDAPSFDTVVHRRPRPTAIVRRRPGAALAIAAGVLAAVLVYGALRSSRVTVPEAVVALSQWRAASDVLLDTPGKALLTHAPQLGASLLDLELGGMPR